MRLLTPRLGVDALDVVACRLLRNEQLIGNLAIRPALRDEPQNLDLSSGEPGRKWRPLRRPVTGGRQHGLHGLGIVASGARFPAQFACGIGGVESGATRTRFP